MIGWVLFWAAFAVGYVVCYRRIYVFMLDSMTFGPGEPDTFDKGMSQVFALIFAAAFPVILVGWAFTRVATPVTAREREAALRKREARVRQLERELGIGDGDDDA